MEFPKSKAVRLSALSMAGRGPAFVSAAHFVQAVMLLRELQASLFSTFAFLFALAALSWAAWNMLFCAPLPHLVLEVAPNERRRREEIFGAANLLAATLVGGLTAVACVLVGVTGWAAALCSIFVSLSLVRTFGRAYAYLHDLQSRPFQSDMIYSLVLLFGLAAMWLLDAFSLSASFAAMAIGALLAILPFGRQYLRILLTSLRFKSVADYVSLNRARAPWSLLSLFCTELTNNAPVYIVTLLRGADAYAPIAATALLLRPIHMIAGALRDIARPKLARLLTGEHRDDVLKSLHHVRLILFASWLVTIAAVILLFVIDPRLLFPAEYDLTVLAIGIVLWSLVGLSFVWRIPEGTLLQALGVFRGPAVASLAAAGASVSAVTLLLFLAPPIWSIGGILVGQAINTAATAAQTRTWRRHRIGITEKPLPDLR